MHTVFMPKESFDKWIAALRSGEYRQGRMELHDKVNDTYCCLGVMQHCLTGKTEEDPVPSRTWLKNQHIRFLTDLSTKTSTPWLESLNTDAAAANDNRVNFNVIADALEAAYGGESIPKEAPQMNIQEAKALALEAFKKELKEPGWELYEHGIAKGPWVAFPCKSELVSGASCYWRHKGAHVLFHGETVAHGEYVGEDTAAKIWNVLDDTKKAVQTFKSELFVERLQHYLSKHPLEAP